ncbi:hypothetical protein WV31_07400 [Magnetospirillum sp. ME-1]|uniref:helix-turn-helix domain-containing protein n=1 Tax=Magnetospirillum sp. ME-1 TaxID=1639348 RepID=UPI000A179DBA|nr:helix-turn-helix domain-containing protein [Magnetospirillum sp. ME-1]ARJ65489.1 hypothetical protein WV31_07400 [Magnetospirillum sp. ME-1]
MEEMLRYIAPDALPEFGKYLKRLLGEIHTKVSDAEKHSYRVAALERQRQAIHLCARRAYARIVGGMDRDESIRQAAREVPYPPEAVIAYHVKLMEKKQAARLRARRDGRIFAMMREGKSNAEIARSLGVSPSTVAKTLSKGEPT